MVIIPREVEDSHFNVDGEDLRVPKGTSVAMFVLPSLVPVYGVM